MRITSAIFALALCAVPAAAQQRPDPAIADAAIKAGFPTAPADWAPRLTGDDTMQQCSVSRNSPSKDVADAIQKRELASIVYPPDNNFMGDWKKGEALAQSGYGLRFTDYPARQANGGNCYACHQLTKKEVSYGTLGPVAVGIRQAARLQAGGREGDLREDLQLARRVPLLHHAALRRQQGADHRADQGCGRAADEPGEPGEYGAVIASW